MPAAIVCWLIDIAFALTNIFYALAIPYWDGQCNNNGAWLTVKTVEDWWGNYYAYWYDWRRAC